MDKAYIIAELAKSHGGSVEEAKRLAFTAIEAGADCVKLQYYNENEIPTSHLNWQRYQDCYLSLKELSYLKEEIEKQGADFLVSCFNKELFAGL